MSALLCKVSKPGRAFRRTLDFFLLSLEGQLVDPFQTEGRTARLIGPGMTPHHRLSALKSFGTFPLSHPKKSAMSALVTVSIPPSKITSTLIQASDPPTPDGVPTLKSGRFIFVLNSQPRICRFHVLFPFLRMSFFFFFFFFFFFIYFFFFVSLFIFIFFFFSFFFLFFFFSFFFCPIFFGFFFFFFFFFSFFFFSASFLQVFLREVHHPQIRGLLGLWSFPLFLCPLVGPLDSPRFASFSHYLGKRPPFAPT